MIVYNITTKIAAGIEKEWLQWQKEESIPVIMATGHFTAFQLHRLLEQDDEDGITYVIQFTASGIEQYQEYIDTVATSLLEKAFDKWGDQFISFHSVMEVVQ